jgi:ATP-dependent RNA helicase DHX37/DHR1
VKDFLALSPSFVFGPASQRRVGDLLDRMHVKQKSKIGKKIIDSRAALRDAWNADPNFLYPEIKAWYQDKFHSQFDLKWEQMHQEVRLEGHELFPKRSKKDKG